MDQKKQKEDLLREIEGLREKLNYLLSKEIAISAYILDLSEQLDQLIFEFYELGI